MNQRVTEEEETAIAESYHDVGNDWTQICKILRQKAGPLGRVYRTRTDESASRRIRRVFNTMLTRAAARREAEMRHAAAVTQADRQIAGGAKMRCKRSCSYDEPPDMLQPDIQLSAASKQEGQTQAGSQPQPQPPTVSQSKVWPSDESQAQPHARPLSKIQPSAEPQPKIWPQPNLLEAKPETSSQLDASQPATSQPYGHVTASQPYTQVTAVLATSQPYAQVPAVSAASQPYTQVPAVSAASQPYAQVPAVSAASQLYAQVTAVSAASQPYAQQPTVSQHTQLPATSQPNAGLSAAQPYAQLPAVAKPEAQAYAKYLYEPQPPSRFLPVALMPPLGFQWPDSPIQSPLAQHRALETPLSSVSPTSCVQPFRSRRELERLVLEKQLEVYEQALPVLQNLNNLVTEIRREYFE